MVKVHKSEAAQRPAPAGLSYELGQKFFNRPLAMCSDSAGLLVRAIDAQQFDAPLIEGSKFVGTRDYANRFSVTDDGIAIVSVMGSLIDRGAFLGDFYGWFTTYEGLAEQCRRLAKDSAVKTVLLDISSAGGMVAGLWDLCAEIEKLKAKKRVVALAQNAAYSAAYAIGCAAHELHVTRSGGVGSIGVLAVHRSLARMNEAAGVDVTILAAGEHKADMNPFQALGHGARAELSASIEADYAAFCDHVAAHRSELDAEAVRATEARAYYGAQAVSEGLADSVKSIDELLDHIRRAQTQPPVKSAKADEPEPDRGAPATPKPKGEKMSRAKASAEAPAEAPTAAAEAETETQAAAAVEVANAAAAERQRIQAITGSPAGKAAPGLAAHLAFSTDMDAAAAVAALEAAAADVTAQASSAAATAADPAPAKPAAENATQAGAASALAAEMSKPGNSAGVAPEGDGDKRPSLAAKAADRFEKRTKRTVVR